MPSYIDLSMTLFFVGAAVLLCLVLISFILLSRRAQQSERRLDDLQDLVQKLNDETIKLHDELSVRDRRIEACERENESFREALQQQGDSAKQQDEILSKYQLELSSLGDEIKALREEFKKQIAGHDEPRTVISKKEAAAADVATNLNKVDASKSVAPAPKESNIVAAKAKLETSDPEEMVSEDNARKLIKSGMELNEVASRTGLSNAEIDMIANMLRPAAHDMRNESMSAVEATLPPRSSVPSDHVAESEGQSEKTVAPAPVRHVASLKARNAYGISSLRRHH